MNPTINNFLIACLYSVSPIFLPLSLSDVRQEIVQNSKLFYSQGLGLAVSTQNHSLLASGFSQTSS